ncbi:hypothetical protein PT974_01776 [Cladobotryum mycophilum]|uniref:F-box domain-containing protein n=1 Tax=Cladobotryum mycophilum TaxID=491253 RepID=A0ABR0SWF5_9HYPO
MVTTRARSKLDNTPKLYKLPPELWDHIAKLCDRYSLYNLSLASKHCREFLLETRFRRTRIFNIRSLYLFSSQRRFKDSPDVRQYIRHLTLKVRPKPAYTTLPSTIINVLTPLRQLQSLSFDFSGIDRAGCQKLCQLITDSPRWEISYLAASGRVGLVSTALGHCIPGILEELYINFGITSAAFAQAAALHPGLKKLRVSIPERYSFADMSLPSISSAMLDRISDSFKDLQWLVVHDKWPIPFIDDNEFDKLIGQSLVSLKRFQSLRRLSFTFSPSDLDLIHDSLASVPPFPTGQFMGNRENIWFAKLIHYLSDEMPKLRHLCIVDANRDWSVWGTRTKDGERMVVERFGMFSVEMMALRKHGIRVIGNRETMRFPIGLLE